MPRVLCEYFEQLCKILFVITCKYFTEIDSGCTKIVVTLSALCEYFVQLCEI